MYFVARNEHSSLVNILLFKHILHQKEKSGQFGFCFLTGNAQGKNQKEGVLGKERPYLLKPLWAANPVWIHVPPAPHTGPLYQGDVMHHVVLTTFRGK